MQQFFVDDCQIGREYVTITGPDVRYMRAVLRMKPGEKIRVSSASGRNLLCAVSEISDAFVQADIIDGNAPDTELPSRITLFQAIPKGDRMEYVIQKAVELGVSRIVPVAMKYCVVRLDAKKAANKQKRWQSIALSAARQSKRSVIPQVCPVMTLEEALAEGKRMDLRIVPYENARGMQSTAQVLPKICPGQDIGVYIGPEGGFAEEEIEALRPSAEVISLGRRILRTDTAAVTVMSFLSLRLEYALEQQNHTESMQE